MLLNLSYIGHLVVSANDTVCKLLKQPSNGCFGNQIPKRFFLIHKYLQRVVELVSAAYKTFTGDTFGFCSEFTTRDRSRPKKPHENHSDNNNFVFSFLLITTRILSSRDVLSIQIKKNKEGICTLVF